MYYFILKSLSLHANIVFNMAFYCYRGSCTFLSFFRCCSCLMKPAEGGVYLPIQSHPAFNQCRLTSTSFMCAIFPAPSFLLGLLHGQRLQNCSGQFLRLFWCAILPEEDLLRSKRRDWHTFVFLHVIWTLIGFEKVTLPLFNQHSIGFHFLWIWYDSFFEHFFHFFFIMDTFGLC